MSQLPAFVSYLINLLADLLTSPPLFGLIAIWSAAFVIKLTLSLLKGGKFR